MEEDHHQVVKEEDTVEDLQDRLVVEKTAVVLVLMVANADVLVKRDHAEFQEDLDPLELREVRASQVPKVSWVQRDRRGLPAAKDLPDPKETGVRSV